MAFESKYKILDNNNNWVDPCIQEIRIKNSANVWTLLDPINTELSYFDGTNWIPCNCGPTCTLNVNGLNTSQLSVLYIPFFIPKAANAIDFSFASINAFNPLDNLTYCFQVLDENFNLLVDSGFTGKNVTLDNGTAVVSNQYFGRNNIVYNPIPTFSDEQFKVGTLTDGLIPYVPANAGSVTNFIQNNPPNNIQSYIDLQGVKRVIINEPAGGSCLNGGLRIDMYNPVTNVLLGTEYVCKFNTTDDITFAGICRNNIISPNGGILFDIKDNAGFLLTRIIIQNQIPFNINNIDSFVTQTLTSQSPYNHLITYFKNQTTSAEKVYLKIIRDPRYNGYTDRGTYNASATYTYKDRVDFGSQLYYCNVATVTGGGNPNFNPAWSLVTDIGDIIAGSGFAINVTCSNQEEPPISVLYDATTELNIWFDNSGSMEDSLDGLEAMRDTYIKPCLIGFYNNDDVLYNEKVKIFNMYSGPIFDFNERFVKCLSIPKNFQRTVDNSVKLVINLTFADESTPYGVGGVSPLIPQPPFQQFLDDVIDVKTSVQTALSTGNTYFIKGYAFVINTNNGIYQGFRNLTQATFINNNTYTALNTLSDYYNAGFFKFNLDVIASSTGIYYTQQVLTALNELGLYIPPCPEVVPPDPYE